MSLIKPKEIKVKNRDGEEKTFVISRLPALAGREIMATYPVTNLPKLGHYRASEEAMLLLMKHVAVDLEGGSQIELKTSALIDNHVDDGEQLLRLEFEMLKYNTSFFGSGGESGYLVSMVKQHLPSIIRTLTDSLQQSSQADSPATPTSKNG